MSSRRFTSRLWVFGALASFLAACTSTPQPAPDPAPRTQSPKASEPVSVSPDAERPQAVESAQQGAAGPAPAAPATPPVEISARAVAEFERAVEMMRAGRTQDAELELQQLALAHPQLAGPHLNLGILYRKAGRLEESEKALRAATERNPANAAAWNELGLTLRQRGAFREALEAYERAVAADPGHAPAYRNMGVLLDLYLDEPERALDAFERYRELTGEDKPVSGWIAELRQRTGRPAPAPAAAPPVPDDAPPSEEPEPQPSGSARD